LSQAFSSADLAQLAAELACDRKATDIVVLNLIGISSMADYFVICGGRSDIHVRAICDRVAEGMRDAGHATLSREGVENGQWALLDFGHVVVHVFQEATRQLYDLERLWNQAPRWTYEPRSAIEQSRA
jgi:ribosome-associated protein